TGSETVSTPKIALDFKSATLYALRAVLHSPDTGALVAALDQRMAEAGAFYENEPVVLDALQLDQSPDWETLIAALRRHQLHPIGVLAEGRPADEALAAGLAPVEVSGARPAPAKAASPDEADAAAAAATGQATPVAPSATPPGDDAAPAPAEAPGTLVVRHPL